MARPSTSSRRYAEAAFQIAQRDGTVEAWLEQLDRAAAVVSDQTAVRQLENPRIPFDARREALANALGPDAMPQLMNLAALILRRRRLELLGGIAREYRRLYNRQEGIVEATATSAVELDEGELQALRERLERMAGDRIILHTRVDESLLGGIQVRIGDRLIDGSVRGRLERLRNELAARA